MSVKVSRYRELDSLRGIAALIVVLFHYTMEREQARLGFSLGITGVDLFFIISGFVIFMTIKKVSVTFEFCINRFTRLFPTYWTCVTFTFLLISLAGIFSRDFSNISVVQYFANLTMVQYYMGVGDLDGPYWTMLVELLFYISIGILFTVKKLKYIFPIGITILLAGILNDLLVARYVPIVNGLHKAFPLYTHFPLFFAGIIFYKVMHPEKGAERAILLYTGLIICYISKLVFFDNGGRGAGFITFHQYALVLFFYFLFFILFVHNLLRFIIVKPLLFLGKISYPLYLVHHYISLNILLPFLLNELNLNFWIACIISVTVVISISALISYRIEYPVDKKWNNALRNKFHLKKRMAK